MGKIKKYLKIYWIHFKVIFSRDLSFRTSFFSSIIGSVSYVFLSGAMIFFLTEKVQIQNWTQKEMWVLLGNFYIITYSIFFFFYRGLLRLIRNIRNGNLDYFLLKPIDSQYLVSIVGGGIHNLIPLVFGIVILSWAVYNLYTPINLFQIVFTIITLILAILDFYSWILMLITLNFRFGHLEEVMDIAISFQDFARFPLVAFTRLPILLLVLVIPFSALSSIPSIILIDKVFPFNQVMIFTIISLIFIYSVRKMWFRAIRSYTSTG